MEGVKLVSPLCASPNIVFGVGRLPEIGGAVGKAIKEFRTSTSEPAKDKAAIQERSPPL